jgi:hypothetical protein
MIYESSYWKDDLLKQAKRLRQRLTQKRWLEQSFARTEQTIMIGFYSIRKLIEAHKVSDTVKDQVLPVTAFNWSGEPINKINRTCYWENYDLENGQVVQRDLIFVCNQIIHSYVFELWWDEKNALKGIIVSSDREKNKVLYLISIQQITDLFEQIGTNYPSKGTFTFNERTQDYDISFSQ